MKPTGLKPGRLPGLGLEPGVEVARVLAHLGRGLGGRAEGDHQPGRVPGGARGEPVALEQHHVLPAHVGQVVGDRAADDAAADDDDARALGQDRVAHAADSTRRARGSPSPRRAGMVQATRAEAAKADERQAPWPVPGQALAHVRAMG